MNFTRPCAILVLLLAACSRGDTTPASAPPTWTVGARTVGTTPLGQAPATFATGQQIAGDLAPTGSACIYWRPRGAPAGLSFMIDSGRVVRADVDSSGVRTAKGVGVGSAVREVEMAYGASLQSQPHKYNYEQGWRSLTVWESDSTAALVFEVDSHTVRTYHAGLVPEVLFVERCS